MSAAEIERKVAEYRDALSSPKPKSSSGISDETFFYYNNLLHSPDPYLMCKMFARNRLLEDVLRRGVPGDVVECGVHRGSHAMQMAKTLVMNGAQEHRGMQLFDFFEADVEMSDAHETALIQELHARSFPSILSGDLHARIAALGFPPSRITCITGNAEETIPSYYRAHPGSQVAFANLDLDVGRPTRIALEQIWPLVQPGGVVVLDEYGAEKWKSEADEADAYFSSIGFTGGIQPLHPFITHLGSAFVLKASQ